MKIYKRPLYLLISALLAGSAFSQTNVLTDNWSYSGAGAGTLNGDLNVNVPARQTGTITTLYTSSATNPVAGVTIAVEDASTVLSGGPDAMFLRTVTDAEPGNLGLQSTTSVGLDSDFAPGLDSTQWTMSYTARLVEGNALADSYFGIGLGTSGAPAAGPGGADAFFFALRPNGDWLLWNDSAAGFNSGSLSGWVQGQEYSIVFNVDESGASPLLSITVTPEGGSAQNIITDLVLGAFGGNRLFRFESSIVNNGTGAFTDARMTNFQLQTVPSSGQLPAITAFDYDAGADTVEFTWSSAPGKTYSLNYTQDLSTGFTDVLDGAIASGGESTSYGPVASPVPGATSLFFRVSEN